MYRVDKIITVDYRHNYSRLLKLYPNPIFGAIPYYSLGVQNTPPYFRFFLENNGVDVFSSWLYAYLRLGYVCPAGLGKRLR